MITVWKQIWKKSFWNTTFTKFRESAFWMESNDGNNNNINDNKNWKLNGNQNPNLINQNGKTSSQQHQNEIRMESEDGYDVYLEKPNSISNSPTTTQNQKNNLKIIPGSNLQIRVANAKQPTNNSQNQSKKQSENKKKNGNKNEIKKDAYTDDDGYDVNVNEKKEKNIVEDFAERNNSIEISKKKQVWFYWLFENWWKMKMMKMKMKTKIVFWEINFLWFKKKKKKKEFGWIWWIWGIHCDEIGWKFVKRSCDKNRYVHVCLFVYSCLLCSFPNNLAKDFSIDWYTEFMQVTAKVESEAPDFQDCKK